MSDIILDFPFGVDDLSKLFDVVDLLENRKELIEEFTPEVQKLMVRKTFFTGPFRNEYNKAFDELIVKLIKSQIVKHFPSFTPEEILALSDTTFLKMITENFYFNPDSYVTKDGTSESTH